MDGEAWWATVPGVTKSWTQLSDGTTTAMNMVQQSHFWVFIYLMKTLIWKDSHLSAYGSIIYSGQDMEAP